MGLKKFNIIFDNPYKTYYAGQTVKGKLEVKLDSPKNMRAILLKVKGEARVSWTERRTSRRNQQGRSTSDTIYMTAEEVYLKDDYYCLQGDGGSTVELPIGKYVYPFAFVLPPNLPSSFEGYHGHIRYTIKAIIDRPWKFDHETKQAFTVLCHYDLNTNPELNEAASAIMEKFMCCLWCRSGPLSCVVTVPKTGYVPGESIAIFSEIDNNSNINVGKVKFELQKVISYYSRYPRRDVKRTTDVIEVVEVGPTLKYSAKQYSPVITLPPLPPSNLTYCNIIDLNYQLKIILNVDGCHANLNGCISISIGTVPLRVMPTAPPLGSFAANTSTGWPVGEQEPTFGIYNYGASTLKDEDDNQHNQFDMKPFYPMYPVYNFNNPLQK